MKSESKFVVTINRQFGSLGRPIAKRAAELLGIPFYDRDIVERAVRETDLRVHHVSEEEEKPFTNFGRMEYPLGIGTEDTKRKIFDVQRQFIIDKASVESCIFVGRCSDYILEDHDNLIRIFIYAPYQARFENCTVALHMEQKEAIRMIKAVDKARSKYHQMYAGYQPDDRDHVDLMINSAALGVEGSAALIADTVRLKMQDK